MSTPMRTDPTAAIVVYQGVEFDEVEVMRFVLSRLPDLDTVTVGRVRGTFGGPGGAETAEVTLDDVGNPEIIAVPGGIGAHQRSEIADWLKTVSPSWILASSTGSVLLAAAGLLHGGTAATHWLAGPILERYGSRPSSERVVVDGRIVMCSGSTSTFRGALVIARAYGGIELVQRIRDEAAGGSANDEEPETLWGRLWDSFWPSRRKRAPRYLPSAQAIEDTEVLDLGLYVLPSRTGQPDDDVT